MRRLAALSAEDVIYRPDIEGEFAEPMPADDDRRRGGSLGEAIDFHLAEYFDAHDDGLPPAGLYDRILREVERPLIERTLVATRGNQIKAAQVLGLNRNTLRKKIRDLSIEVTRGGEPTRIGGSVAGR